MHRNLDRRIETLFPIEDLHLRDRVRGELLDDALSDNTKIRWPQSDGTYSRATQRQCASQLSRGPADEVPGVKRNPFPSRVTLFVRSDLRSWRDLQGPFERAHKRVTGTETQQYSTALKGSDSIFGWLRKRWNALGTRGGSVSRFCGVAATLAPDRQEQCTQQRGSFLQPVGVFPPVKSFRADWRT